MPFCFLEQHVHQLSQIIHPPPSPTPFTHSMISGAFLKTYFVTDKIILSKANFVGLYFMQNVINFTILNHTHAIIWVLGQFVFIKWCICRSLIVFGGCLMQKRESPEVDISANGQVLSNRMIHTILLLSFLNMVLHSMNVAKSQLLANFIA